MGRAHRAAQDKHSRGAAQAHSVNRHKRKNQGTDGDSNKANGHKDAGSTAKKPKQPAAAPASAEPTGPTAASVQSSGCEIDELFGKLKNKSKPAKEPAADRPAEAAPAKDKSKVNSKKVEGSKDDIFGSEAAAARKRTEEGYAIYKEDELGLGKKGGDTDLCPFDCECCH